MKDNNLGLVLVASALVIMAGAISLGMAGLIEAVSPDRGLGYGDGANFVGHWITYLGSNHLPEDLFSISW